jgi:hypothetical protein
MLAGPILLLLGLLGLGFVGLALRKRSVGAVIDDPASGEQPSEPEAELAKPPVADRKAKLEEEKRDRWAR